MTIYCLKIGFFQEKDRPQKEHYIVQDFYAFFQRKAKIFSVFPKNFFGVEKNVFSVK